MMKYLTAGEEQTLLEAASGGDIKARNSVIMNAYAIVRSTVGKRFSMSDSEKEDAVQFVVTVLCEKFHKFDATRKIRYMTYANFWVRYALQQFKIKRHLIPSRKKPVSVTSIESGEQHDNYYLHKYLCAPNPSPDHALENGDDLAELNRVMSQLHPKERGIVLRRSRGEKLQAIADSMGITRERVRQIEIQAIQRMREWFRC